MRKTIVNSTNQKNSLEFDSRLNPFQFYKLYQSPWTAKNLYTNNFFSLSNLFIAKHKTSPQFAHRFSLRVNMLWLTLILVAATATYVYWKRCNNYWRNLGVPQTNPTILFGDTFYFFFKIRPLTDFINYIYRKTPAGSRYTLSNRIKSLRFLNSLLSFQIHRILSVLEADISDHRYGPHQTDHYKGFQPFHRPFGTYIARCGAAIRQELVRSER